MTPTQAGAPALDDKTAEVLAAKHRYQADQGFTGQTRIALRLYAIFAGLFCYVTDERRWLSWVAAAGRWTDDLGEVLLTSALLQVVLQIRTEAKLLLADAARLLALRTPTERQTADAGIFKAMAAALLTDARAVESASGMKGALTIAGKLSGFATLSERLNQDPYLLNTPNGTLDLRTFELMEHNPLDMITKITRANYDRMTPAPVFHSFINQILPDEETRTFVQRAFGEALIGKVREQILVILNGTGSNGKSTLTKTMGDTLGDYACEAQADVLIAREHTHTSEMYDLRGKRVVFTQESEESKTLAVATVKKLTGGDPIRARQLYRDSIQFDPTWLIFMVTNKLPKVPSDDYALWRRVLVVLFDVTIDAADRDPHLPDALALEWHGALAWAIDGLRQVNELGGLKPPATVIKTTETYRQTSDYLALFIKEECTLSPHVYEYTRALWSRYQEWCRAAGVPAGTERQLGIALEAIGHQKRTRTAAGVPYGGLELKPRPAADDGLTGRMSDVT